MSVHTDKMRIISKNAVTILVALSVIICGTRQALPDETLTLAYPSFFPFHARSETGQVEGFFHDILAEAITKRMGIQLSWHELPWPRCQSEVKKNTLHAMITVPTKERLTYASTHPSPFYLKELVVFTYAGHPRLPLINEITSLDDVKQLNLSVITYIGNGWNKKHVESIGIPTIESPYLETIWPMLANQRGDLVIEWPPGARPNIKMLNLEDKIIQTDAHLDAMPFHLLVNRHSFFADKLPEFQTIIQEMIRDGSLESIIAPFH